MAFPFKRSFSFLQDRVWSKVLLFCLTVFLIKIADAVISYWAPNQIQSVLKNPIIMGLTISFQSVVGFLADLVFPGILRKTNVRRLIFLGIITSALTVLFLVGAYYKPLVLILLITMGLWGIYYELEAFAAYQFMGSVVPAPMRAGAWGVLGIFGNLAYFLGPLIGAYLLLKSVVAAGIVVLILLVLALIILLLGNSSHEMPAQVDLVEVNPWEEIKHWAVLAKHIWPAIIITLLLGVIDSTFWTTGAVWSGKLARISPWGGMFLPLYQLPSIFLGLVIAKWRIKSGKKILSEKVLIIAGLFLIGLTVSGGMAWQLTMVFLSAIALSICYPLIQGVYTDIVVRMGKDKKEMIGLISSSANIAYIIWPPVAGYITSLVGERLTFSVVGGIVVFVSVILLFVTPRKLKLPQEEIKSWE